MGQQLLRVDRGLARGSVARFVRSMSYDVNYFKSSYIDFTRQFVGSRKRKLSADDVEHLIQVFSKNSELMVSSLRRSVIRHSKTSSATTVLNFYFGYEFLSIIEDDENIILSKKVTDQSFKQDGSEPVLYLHVNKLFIDRSQFTFLLTPLFLNISLHLVERWCSRTNSLDAAPVVDNVRMNLGFIEYLRNVISSDSSVVPIAVPFKEGLALGSHIWMNTTDDNGDINGNTYFYKCDLSSKSSRSVKKISNPFSHHQVFGMSERKGNPNITLRTFISFSEMKTGQIILYDRLSQMRDIISEPMMKMYEILLASPEDSLKRKNPTVDFQKIKDNFEFALEKVNRISASMVREGLWEEAMKVPKNSRFYTDNENVIKNYGI